jgi:hypothetical protein
MKICTTFWSIVAALALTAPSSFAQSASRTAVSFTGGLASGASDTGVALGGSVVFDVTERLSIEGQGTYLDRGAGADGFAASGSLLVNLLDSSEQVVPYAAIGGGVYHVSYDLAHPRFLGPAGTQFAAGSTVCPAPGTGFGFGPGPGLGRNAGTCPGTAVGYWGVGALPSFYARRLGPLAFPRGGAWETRSFTDPALNVGGGVRLNLTERLMLRPDIRALLVFAEGETHTLGMFVVNLGYRF